MNTSSSPAPKSSSSRLIKLLIKIAVTIFCFWYISTKINFSKSLQALLGANWVFLGAAVLLYALSKLLSAFRLNIYFRNIKLGLPEWENIKLYWLGMFYNLFLPGAIGGDAYKVILLNKKLGAPYKKTSIAVLLDRFSGLLGLGVLLSIYGILVLNSQAYISLLVTGTVLAIIGLYLVIRFSFREFLPGFLPTFLWGLMVQAIQVICVYCLLQSLHMPLSKEWIFIFLFSSVVAVFPVSMGGGLGTRELVFAEGAAYFYLDAESGVTISLLFFLCNVLSCVPGVYNVFQEPLKSNMKPR